MKKGITNILFELVLGAAVIMLMGYWFDGVYVKSFGVAFLVALVLALLNTFIKPILTIIALPITILSLGIFQLIINGFILTLATDLLAPDFYINSFGLTIVTSVCISIIYSLLGIGKLND
ncbi:phage holin family protein [Candidatus Stoquefichus massiliensis]|uniref:phage holin family protein n=1 Tax=Candidatus Stoquefichus massiliensis TaxID=1470350 RepID=UPI000483EA3E|nr:phage holin family protein [Candidatus Stoquefichus massiliensis]